MIRILTVFFCLFFLNLPAAEYPLVRDGRANAVIVRFRGASAVDLFAGNELRDYVEKITGATLGRIRKPSEDRINIYIATLDQKGFKLPQKAAELADKIRDDGFLLYTDPSGLYIAAKERRGLNYGVYEILKRYGNVRWITPGPDGEFVPKKGSFLVPELAEVVNPSFRHRRFNLVSSYGSIRTPLWQMRNGMTQSGPLYGGGKNLGGHVFSTLLPDTLFPEKPELFGLYKGKRLPQCGKILSDPKQYKTGGQANQPCTSNPETIRIMQENLVKILKANPEAESFCILNNDSTAWCECENCRKLDPPEERKRGMVATRFWLLANALIEAGVKAAPQVRFFSSPYQTFQELPAGVVPDPRAEINFCLHHRCYLHSIGDSRCEINERYRRILEGWHLQKRNVQTYEYTNILPRGEVWYLPLAPLLHRDLKYYHSIGNDGWCDEVAPYDGNFITKDRQVTERWIGNALDLYLTANLLWNVKADYNALEDDAGSLYYGNAWSAMKQFRHLLARTYEGINDHFCYGSRLWQLGRALEEPDASKQLNVLLQKAELAAKGDFRVEKIVKRDAEFYRLTFEKAAEEFRSSHRENDVRANRYDPQGNSWNLSDWACVGTLPVRLQYDEHHLYLKHAAAGNGAFLEAFTEDGVRKIPVEKAGVARIPIKRKAAEGESHDLGLVLSQDGRKSSWNGSALKVPGIYRKLIFGNNPILKNGNFAVIDSKKEGRIPRHFGMRGKLEIQSDGTAASGNNFLRGSGFVFQYLTGLQGTMQTYGIPEHFRGVLRVRVQFRGEGKASVRLTSAKLGLIGEKSAEIASPGKWQDTEFLFDCAKSEEPLLLLYVFSHSPALDMDDIRVEKTVQSDKKGIKE